MSVIMNVVADNMRLFRDNKHLSQKEVALSVGIPQGQYSRIENGIVEPSLSTLEKLTNFFGISMAELFQSNKQVINTNPDLRLSNFSAHKTLLILCSNGKDRYQQKAS